MFSHSISVSEFPFLYISSVLIKPFDSPTALYIHVLAIYIYILQSSSSSQTPLRNVYCYIRVYLLTPRRDYIMRYPCIYTSLNSSSPPHLPIVPHAHLRYVNVYYINTRNFVSQMKNETRPSLEYVYIICIICMYIMHNNIQYPCTC